MFGDCCIVFAVSRALPAIPWIYRKFLCWRKYSNPYLDCLNVFFDIVCRDINYERANIMYNQIEIQIRAWEFYSHHFLLRGNGLKNSYFCICFSTGVVLSYFGWQLLYYVRVGRDVSSSSCISRTQIYYTT